MELLRTGDMQSLEALTAARPGVVRHVLGRLWDDDPVIRERAGAVIGNAAAHHHDLGVELLRRFAWALNDESATNGVFVIPAVAEIAIMVPELARPFVGQLIGALDDPGLSEAAQKALDLIRRRQPELVVSYEGEIANKKEQEFLNGGRDSSSSTENAN